MNFSFTQHNKSTLQALTSNEALKLQVKKKVGSLISELLQYSSLREAMKWFCCTEQTVTDSDEVYDLGYCVCIMLPGRTSRFNYSRSTFYVAL